MSNKIKSALGYLILTQPFFAHMALNTPIEESDRVATMAMDGKRIFYNKDFLAKLTKANTVAVICHELLHPMGQYFERMGDRDPRVWNFAHDFVINQIIVDEEVGELPSVDGMKPVYDQEVYDEHDGSAERIYEWLKQQDGSGSGSIDGKKPFDEPMKAARGGASAVSDEWAMKVVQAASAAKAMGNLPGSIKRLVDDIVSRQIDWRGVLNDFLVEAREDCRTWRRCNRRLAAQGVYSPAATGETLGHVVVAVDASGSVSDEDMATFQGELNNLVEDLSPEGVTVLVFDTKVRDTRTFDHGERVDLSGATAGGGTSYADVMRKVGEMQPTALVVLTDMECDTFGDNPRLPVLWLTDNKHITSAPFGKVIHF